MLALSITSEIKMLHRHPKDKGPIYQDFPTFQQEVNYSPYKKKANYRAFAYEATTSLQFFSFDV